MIANLKTATYTKLRDGSWGIRVTGKPIAGETVHVTLKSGATKLVDVAKVLWSDDKLALCSIAGAGEQRTRQAARRHGLGNRAPGGRTCPSCGARDCPRAWNGRDLCQED
jgi:hypothetical protein